MRYPMRKCTLTSGSGASSCHLWSLTKGAVAPLLLLWGLRPSFIPSSQGWGFFTKDPKEVTIDVYQLEEKTLKLISINNFSLQNLFGFSREARYIGFEFGKLEQYIPKMDYKNGLGTICKTYPNTTTVVKIPFIPKFHPIGKEFVVYQYKIVPFTWINQNQEHYRPYLVARIKFEYAPSASYNPIEYFEKNR